MGEKPRARTTAEMGDPGQSHALQKRRKILRTMHYRKNPYHEEHAESAVSKQTYRDHPEMQAQSQISADKLQINHKENRDKGGGVHTTFRQRHKYKLTRGARQQRQITYDKLKTKTTRQTEEEEHLQNIHDWQRSEDGPTRRARNDRHLSNVNDGQITG